MGLDKKRKTAKKDVAAAAAAAGGAPDHGAEQKRGQGRPAGKPKKAKLFNLTLPTGAMIDEYAEAESGGNTSAFAEKVFKKYFKENPLEPE